MRRYRLKLLATVWLLSPLAVLVVLAVPPVLVLTGGLLSRSFVRSWRPVRKLIRAAGALADGDYTARVTPTGSSSMRRVVTSFNDMAERLESADEQRRRLLGDLSHELRTPLTVVRGELEAMLSCRQAWRNSVTAGSTRDTSGKTAKGRRSEDSRR